MFDVFMYSFNAVMPILLLVLLGWFLRKINFASQDFFKKANALVFKLFLPLLLFCNIYDIETLSHVNWAVIGYIVVIVLLLFAMGILVSRLFIKSNLQKGPIIQCVFRSNCAIIGIPLAEALGGAPAVSFTAVATAATIPLFNTLAVICLSYYADENKKPSIKSTLIRTAKNPLIIAVATGLVVIGIRSFIPTGAGGEIVFSLKRDCPFLFNAISSAAKAASPLALVVLGARFDFSAVRGLIKQISLGVIMRIAVAPLVAIGLGVILISAGVLNITRDRKSVV